MADKKISQLSSASTPLAGTEVLPIVQSSATVKVAANDLTVRNLRANATTGILQVTGPAAGSTRIATVPDANFTVARTDAAQNFSGDQTFTNSVGVGGSAAVTSGKNVAITSIESSIALISEGGVSGGRSYTIAAGANYQYTSQALVFRDNTANTERMVIANSGEVYIAGVSDQGDYNLQVFGTGVWGAGAYVNGSDANLKNNVTDMGDCLDLVNALRPVTFTYKPEYSKDQFVQPGFIAQDLQNAFADENYVNGIVRQDTNQLNVAYQALIPVLVKAIQELTTRVEELSVK